VAKAANKRVTSRSVISPLHCLRDQLWRGQQLMDLVE
jgi:hypothetical protein